MDFRVCSKRAEKKYEIKKTATHRKLFIEFRCVAVFLRGGVGLFRKIKKNAGDGT